ncbi:MAG: histidine--tRNA ligase [Candidatus Magasanikbacteria bacterium]|nr:histidine--tRNA ligase [Candidatus Magasanikbacteria bacterium]
MKKTKTKPAKVSKSDKVDKKPTAAPVETNVAAKPKKAFSLIRGMHDILPKDEKYWKALYRTAEHLAEYFQFGRIDTPILEEVGLFVRSVGRGTDIVDKEMYTFEDRDGTKVALRPEPTASIVRAYIQHGLWNAPQPVKVWTFAPMFRHDRPQAGRYRQFYQADFETVGGKDPCIDAELILVAYNFFNDLGLPVEVRVNSLGTPEERERYIAELVAYYRSKRSYLCEDCRFRLTKNPLRLLDCKEGQCAPVKEGAPQLIDWLQEDSKNFFMKVLEYLDELGIPYILNPYLVRGLDYYTHTVFEIFPTFGETGPSATLGTGSQSALGGGGRYDLLAEDLGGRPTPAAGFGIGIERAVTALKQYAETNSIKIANVAPHIFFAELGEDAKRRALRIINQLRASGIRLAYNFMKGSLKNQLEMANSLKVPYVVILGQKEVQDETVILRDMESGVQEIIDQKKLEAALKKKLSNILAVESAGSQGDEGTVV